MRVLLSAGHSNTDPGAVNGQYKEAELVTWFRNAVAYYCREAGLDVVTDGSIVATPATAMLRTAREHGKADYIEASLCSLFSTSIWFMLDWLGLPSEVGIGIGVFIAYIGTLRFSNWVRSKLGIK